MIDVEMLEKLAELKRKKVITQDEFDEQKKIILGNNVDTKKAISVEKKTGSSQKKSIFSYYINVWKTMGKINRITRKEYWCVQLVHFFIGLILFVVVPIKLPPNAFAFLAFFNYPSLVFIISNCLPVGLCGAILFPFVFSVYTRRYHDLGKSAWFAYGMPVLSFFLIFLAISLRSIIVGRSNELLYAIISYYITWFTFVVIIPCFPSKKENKYDNGKYKKEINRHQNTLITILICLCFWGIPVSILFPLISPFLLFLILAIIDEIKKSKTSEEDFSTATYPLDNYILEISNPFKDMPVVETEIKENYSNSSQIRVKAFLDKNRENGYYYEFYPNGTPHVISKKNFQLIYTENFSENGNLIAKAEIVLGKLSSFEWYNQETRKILFGMKYENGIRKVYTLSETGQIKYMTREEENVLFKNLMFLSGVSR